MAYDEGLADMPFSQSSETVWNMSKLTLAETVDIDEDAFSDVYTLDSECGISDGDQDGG